MITQIYGHYRLMPRSRARYIKCWFCRGWSRIAFVSSSRYDPVIGFCRTCWRSAP